MPPHTHVGSADPCKVFELDLENWNCLAVLRPRQALAKVMTHLITPIALGGKDEEKGE